MKEAGRQLRRPYNVPRGLRMMRVQRATNTNIGTYSGNSTANVQYWTNFPGGFQSGR